MTSREPLHVAGERVVSVGPLPVDDAAVTLFVDRACAVRRSFDAAGATREVVARICQRLDGIPLSIELAAGRTLAMTATEIERRLESRAACWRIGAATPVVTAPCSGSSTGALTCWTRAAGRCFAGCRCSRGASMRRRRTLCAAVKDDFATLDVLVDLVDKSLVVAIPAGAYTADRLLETMRQ